jgi:hypothetical protein
MYWIDTYGHATLLQFDISANALEIRAVHNPNCIRVTSDVLLIVHSQVNVNVTRK